MDINYWLLGAREDFKNLTFFSFFPYCHWALTGNDIPLVSIRHICYIYSVFCIVGRIRSYLLICDTYENEIQQFLISRICLVELSQNFSCWNRLIPIQKKTSTVYHK